MNPEKAKVAELYQFLSGLHGSRLGELEERAKIFATYLETLLTSEGFKLDDARQPHEHVGRVIVDGVLQVGKDYEKLVRPAVNRIETFAEAATVSGFIRLLNERKLQDLTAKFKSERIKYDLLRVANFFSDRGDTYKALYEWLKPEEHRDELMTLKRDPNGTVFSVAHKTADYFRKLVGHWEAVAVDTNIKLLLDKARIISRYSRKYDYKERRTIAQLAALHLCCRPIDLDTSIYQDSVLNPWRYERRKQAATESSQHVYAGCDVLPRKEAKMHKDDNESILEVPLPVKKMRQLQAVAQDWAIDEATLARIWILECLQPHGVEIQRLSAFSKSESGEPVERIVVSGRVVAPDREGKRREISGIPKEDCRRITCHGGPLDVSTVEQRFGASWSEKGVLLIPIRLLIGSGEYGATLHYREATGGCWIASPLNGGKVKLAGPLAGEGLKAGDPVELKVLGNRIQVVKMTS